MSLYTSVNVSRTIDHIIKLIYEDPLTFFPPNEKIVKVDQSEKIVILKPPPETLMKKFFSDVVLKYSSFHTLAGFYRQKEGLSMGSKISPSLANILFI